jgi:hypothetical protein
VAQHEESNFVSRSTSSYPTGVFVRARMVSAYACDWTLRPGNASSGLERNVGRLLVEEKLMTVKDGFLRTLRADQALPV